MGISHGRPFSSSSLTLQNGNCREKSPYRGTRTPDPRLADPPTYQVSRLLDRVALSTGGREGQGDALKRPQGGKDGTEVQNRQGGP